MRSPCPTRQACASQLEKASMPQQSPHASTKAQNSQKKKKKIRGILGIDFQVSQGRGCFIATPDVSLPVKELY